MTARSHGAGLAEIFDADSMDSKESLLQLQRVSVRFGGVAALSNVDLDVGYGSLVMIIGPNGAGKTTALNAICGLTPSSGRIVFAEKSISRLNPRQIASAGIGRSFQDPPLIDHYTVLENVLCGAHLRLKYGVAQQVFLRRRVATFERSMMRRARILLDFVGLGHEAHVEAGALSYGSRKLVDIVRAMVAGPRLLLIDEPSSGLDSHEREALQDVLVALRHEGNVSILAVEHHMDLVRSVATKVVALQAGVVLMIGEPSQVLDSDQFRSVVVGDDRETDAGDPLADRASSP